MFGFFLSRTREIGGTTRAANKGVQITGTTGGIQQGKMTRQGDCLRRENTLEVHQSQNVHFCPSSRPYYSSAFRTSLSRSREMSVAPCRSVALHTFVHFCGSKTTSFRRFPTDQLSRFFTARHVGGHCNYGVPPPSNHRKVDFCIFHVFREQLPFLHFCLAHFYAGSGGGR